MKRISKIAESIQPSLTRKLFNMAKQYDDVVDFTLGDPDVPTPMEVKEAGCKAIMEGNTRYSQNAGLLALRKVISQYNDHHEGITYNPENEIIVTVGAMEGLYLALLATIDEGDEVIIPAPYYINYKQMVAMCKGVPVIVEDMENAGSLVCSYEAVAKAVSNRTKAIILNTPCNPTGRIYPDDFIQKIAILAKEKDLLVITDEVYKCLTYDGGKRPKSIASLPGMKERTIFVNSLSKEFCMTGWRIGYVMADKEIVSAMTKLQENVAACAPLPSQYAAIEALRTDRNYSADMARIFSRRRDILIEGFEKSKMLSCKSPEATFYAMIDISKTGMKSEEFAYALLKAEHVAVVPGITYGKICDSFVRMAFTIDEDIIKKGVNRMVKFADSLLNE